MKRLMLLIIITTVSAHLAKAVDVTQPSYQTKSTAAWLTAEPQSRTDMWTSTHEPLGTRNNTTTAAWVTAEPQSSTDAWTSHHDPLGTKNNTTTAAWVTAEPQSRTDMWTSIHEALGTKNKRVTKNGLYISKFEDANFVSFVKQNKNGKQIQCRKNKKNNSFACFIKTPRRGAEQITTDDAKLKFQRLERAFNRAK